MLLTISFIASFFAIAVSARSQRDLVFSPLILLLSTAIFLMAFFLLPSDFGGDQHEYFEEIQHGNIIPDTFAQYKSYVLFLASLLPVSIENNLQFLQIFNALVFSCVLAIVLKNYKLTPGLALIFLLPSWWAHIPLFLREIYAYSLLICFCYSLKKGSKFQYLFLVLIGLFRIECFAILVSIYFFRITNNRTLSWFLVFFYISAIFYIMNLSPLTQFFIGYRIEFGTENPASSVTVFLSQFLNILIPTKGSLFAQLIVVIELFLIVYLILVYQKKYELIAFFLVGAVLIGSVSDNIGFVTRIRAPIIMYFLLMSLLLRERWNVRYSGIFQYK